MSAEAEVRYQRFRLSQGTLLILCTLILGSAAVHKRWVKCCVLSQLAQLSASSTFYMVETVLGLGLAAVTFLSPLGDPEIT